MTCGDDIGARLRLKIQALVPIHSHVLNELEGIHELRVMFGEVGSHLQRRIEGHIQTQLVADGSFHLLSPRHDFTHVGLKDARCIVHRAALQTCERQDGCVPRIDAFPKLRAHGALIANHIGPGATESSGSHRLM